MNPIDRKKFFDGYRNEFGNLKQSQVDGLELLLGFLEADAAIVELSWAAYMLATIKIETANTFLPIREYGTREYFIKRYGSQTKVGKVLGNDTPEEGAIYAGRGYVQLTGESNYEKLERELLKEYPAVIQRWEEKHRRKFDLTVGDQPNDNSDPDNLLDSELSYCVMSIGMRKGLFTGRKLSTYLNGENRNYHDARRIINGVDHADKIALIAVQFEWILEGAS